VFEGALIGFWMGFASGAKVFFVLFVT
jgi:hypothetical protein